MHNSLGKAALGFLLSAASACVAIAQDPVKGGKGDPPLLGATPAQAAKTDFFRFFGIEKTADEKDGKGRAVLVHKPKAKMFRELVTLRGTLDGEKFAGLELTLARSFIDDKQSGVFARDIAKSLIASAVAEADRAAVAELTDEIHYRDARLVFVKKAPKLPEKPSDGFLVYQGKKARAELTLTKCVVGLEGRKVGDADAVVITVRLKE